MNERNIRLLGWLIPAVAMAAAFGALFWQAQRLRDASTQRDHASQLLERALAQRGEAATQARRQVVAALPASAGEEEQFLSDLQRRVKAPGARILKWTSQAQPAGKPDRSNDPVDPVLQGVTAIRSDLTLGGSFPALCAFLRDIQTGDRLFTVSNVNWNRAQPPEQGTVLTCTLSRYVVASDPASSASVNSL